MLTCSAIVGFLCVQAAMGPPTTVELSDGGMSISNTIKGKSWTADWGQSTEWPLPRIDPARLEKACERDACISYWRQCTSGSDGIACTYVFDEGHGYARQVRLKAPDMAGFDAGNRSLGIVAKWGEPVIAVPLAAMKIESKGKPPICASQGMGAQPPCHALQN